MLPYRHAPPASPQLLLRESGGICRERGDPRELLRVINPREAALVDAAAGIHVRFRLGGSTFPPLVFYKIFTHRCGVGVLQDSHT